MKTFIRDLVLHEVYLHRNQIEFHLSDEISGLATVDEVMSQVVHVKSAVGDVVRDQVRDQVSFQVLEHFRVR